MSTSETAPDIAQIAREISERPCLDNAHDRDVAAWAATQAIIADRARRTVALD